MRSLTLAALTAAALATGVARADVTDTLSLTYQSGATFTGTLVLSNDFSSILSLNGTLFGYDPYAIGPAPGSTDPISASTPLMLTSSLGPSTVFTSLPDGNNNNLLDFGYSYSSTGITLNPGGIEDPTQGLVGYNVINPGTGGDDELVSGTVTTVPEPGTLALLGLGLFGLAATHRRRVLNVARR